MWFPSHPDIDGETRKMVATPGVGIVLSSRTIFFLRSTGNVVAVSANFLLQQHIG
jgi:hypothetical protein